MLKTKIEIYLKFSLLLLFLFSSVLYAQIPEGYYDNTEGKEGEALRAALHDIIKNHTVVSYASLWTHFQTTDVKANGKVWCMYSHRPGSQPEYEYTFVDDQCGNYSGEGDCYNREHSWPESWYSHSGSPMRTDLFHVYPTDGYVNAMRANYPFGEVDSVIWMATNGGKLGISNYPGWSGFTVFEPINYYKGDFARTYFYMATRYYGQDAGWAENEMVDGANIKDKPMKMLLHWHTQDPVSQKEIDRNNAVYEIQGNRNPFIDHPHFANAIWDPEYSGIDSSTTNYSFNVYPNPANDNFKIETRFFNKIKQIKIICVNGTTVFVKDCCFNEIISVDPSNLSNGVYFIKLIMEDNYITRERLTVIN